MRQAVDPFAQLVLGTRASNRHGRPAVAVGYQYMTLVMKLDLK